MRETAGKPIVMPRRRTAITTLAVVKPVILPLLLLLPPRAIPRRPHLPLAAPLVMNGTEIMTLPLLVIESELPLRRLPLAIPLAPLVRPLVLAMTHAMTIMPMDMNRAAVGESAIILLLLLPAIETGIDAALARLSLLPPLLRSRIATVIMIPICVNEKATITTELLLLAIVARLVDKRLFLGTIWPAAAVP